MEWIEKLNGAINYIEEHITEEIDYAKLGRIACCSSYHFQRMFAYMADIPISEYIRRRRMSLAALDLKNGEKIIDVAGKYGYSSPTAFNRAFQTIHGIAPSAVKNSGACIKSFPPISFKVIVKGAEAMNYRIEEKEAFRIVGLSMPLAKNIEENIPIISDKWEEVGKNGTMEKLIGIMDTPPFGALGVSIYDDDKEWRYYIAVSSSKENDDMEEYIIPAATWAIFSGSGAHQSIVELERRIVTEWLPTSGYEYGGTLDMEVYLNSDSGNSKYEVWIPVIKKQ